MSEENKDLDLQNEEASIDINDAKQMTIGEAVRKESEIKAGITDEDDVLDKYIKQHRQEVASQKFETKVSGLETLDTASLDNFIKKQREELAKSGFFNPSQSDQEQATEEEILESSEAKLPSADIQEEEKTALTQTAATAEPSMDSSKATYSDVFVDIDEGANKTSKKKVVLTTLFLLLLLIGSAFAWNAWKQNSASPSKAKSSSQQSSETKSSATKIANHAFEKGLKAFYSDAEMSKLKNSEFSHLNDLTKKLEALKGTSYYDKAKEKWELLKKQIAAIQAVNAKFSTEAIKDGEQTAATVKSDVNFDDLNADSLKTGNASLDKLLQTVISDGRKQIEDKTKAEKEKAEAQAKADAEQTAAATSQANASQSANTAAETSLAAQAPTIANFGTYLNNVSGLQRNLSRVPYNNAAIADSTNAAWVFNPGVLERIVATSQARGYFTGNNYYLEPVNIINGNGYYNMFKSDGTYLFSINCKTGYFVGNAKGHADALDY